ncbi:hemicentin-2-like [Mya arenaria]|uniref:hemicentin-2-like n=1 Tax=Mya arenaria TaxID=6604 RepID=UPI0022E8504E|nr:hemicentin-2-like [Mya arenaria]
MKIPVSWFLNNASTNLYIGTHSNMCEKDPPSFPVPYTGDGPNSTVYTLTIDPVTSSMRGDTWRCLANDNSDITVRSNVITIQVTVPIRNVNMTSPTISPVIVNEALTAEFVCTTTFGLPQASVRWYKDNNNPGYTEDDSEISTSISVDYLNNSEVETIATTSTLSYTANRVDNGMAVYCNASNGGEDFTSSIKPILNVQFPPVVLPLGNKTVMEGETVTIDCSFTHGNPKETAFSWSLNKTEVTSHMQLQLERVTREQTGLYTCTASNVMRPSGYISKVKDIHVETFEGRTEVTIIQPLQFSIICDVEGNPKSNITLIKNGVVMKESLYETSLYYAQQSSDCERDTGVYTCTGATPQVPFNLRSLANITDSSITVEWLPGFDGRLPQTFVVQYRDYSSSEWQESANIHVGQSYHIITNLQPGTTYQIQVYAKNDIGRSNSSYIITVATSIKGL